MVDISNRQSALPLRPHDDRTNPISPEDVHGVDGISTGWARDMLDTLHGFDPEQNKNYNVKNGALKSLVRPEYQEYCYNWKNLINPSSNDFSVLYLGSGPDISTPLLTTNATEIHGVDMMDVHPNLLFKYLRDPSLIGERISADHLGEIVDFRQKFAYWDHYGAICQIGMEATIVHELNALGVDLAKVKVEPDPRDWSVTIKFDWAYPDEEAKERKIKFQRNHLNWFLEQNKTKLSPDLVMLKSTSSGENPEKPINHHDNLELIVRSGILNKAKFALFGVDGTTYPYFDALSRNGMDIFTQANSPMHDIEESMTINGKPVSLVPYHWEMVVCRNTPQLEHTVHETLTSD